VPFGSWGMWESLMQILSATPKKSVVSVFRQLGDVGGYDARIELSDSGGRQCLSAVGGCGSELELELESSARTVVSAFRQLGDVGARYEARIELSENGSSVPFGSWGMWEWRCRIPRYHIHKRGRQCLSAVGGCGSSTSLSSTHNLLMVVSAFRQLGDVGGTTI